MEGHPGQLRAEGPAHRHEPALPQRRRRPLPRRVRGVGHRPGEGPLRDDRDRRRSGRGRLGRHLRGLRLDRRHPVPQQPRRQLLRRGGGERRRVQRVRQRAGGHGPRGRRRRRRRAARPAQDPLRRRHPGALPQPRPRPVRGRGDGRGPRGPEPLRAVGGGCPRPRQRRPAGPLLCHRQRLPGDRGPHAGVPAPQPEDRVPQPGRRPLRGRLHPQRAGRSRAALEPWRRLRRLRQRRRPRRPGHEHERAALAAAQRLRRRQRLAHGPAARHALEPGRPRGDGGGDRGRAPAGARRAQPVELLLARRPAAALRPRRRARGRAAWRCAGRAAWWTGCTTLPAGGL